MLQLHCLLRQLLKKRAFLALQPQLLSSLSQLTLLQQQLLLSLLVILLQSQLQPLLLLQLPASLPQA
jgi:hypothetical protein